MSGFLLSKNVTKLVSNLFIKKKFDLTLSKFMSTKNDLTGLLFNQKHEWIKIEDKIGTVGVSEYAQESLGDVVYVLMPEINSDLEINEEAGSIESVKAASEIYSPVSGQVVEINCELESKPGLINKSCYKDGWIYKLKLKNPEELKILMKEEEYLEFLRTIKE